MVLPSVVQLDEFASGELFERLTRGAGTYVQPAEIQGNSILSSVFVESISPGASLKINYYDTTTGAQVGERFDLDGHAVVPDSTAPLTTLRILVTRIHHRVIAEAIVTGGTVKFSLYATVVSSTASDLDQALVSDGQPVDFVNDKGMPVMCLDRDTNTFDFLSCGPSGLLINEGNPLNFTDKVPTTPGTSQDLIDETVPIGKVWKIRKARLSTRAYAYFDIYIDALRIGSGFLGAQENNVNFKFENFVLATAGQAVKISFLQSNGPILDVSANLMVTEENA